MIYREIIFLNLVDLSVKSLQFFSAIVIRL